LKPVIFPNADGTFDIYFKTKGGDKRWVSASSDFRKFSSDEKSLIGDAAWLRDTATVSGQLQEGCLFEISSQELETISSHFRRQKEDARLSSERMHDDSKHLASLQPITATLHVSRDEKAISDKLIGIFFEDQLCGRRRTLCGAYPEPRLRVHTEGSSRLERHDGLECPQACGGGSRRPVESEQSPLCHHRLRHHL